MIRDFRYAFESQTDKNAQFFTKLFGGPEPGAEIASARIPMGDDAFINGLLCGAIPPPVALRAWIGPDGRIHSKEESIAGRVWRWDYAYDDWGRLTRAELDGELVEEYAYDADGMRVSQRTRASGGAKSPCVHDGQGRMVRAGDAHYEWNDDGTLHSRRSQRGRAYFRYAPDGGLGGALLPDGRALAYAHGPGGVPVAKYEDDRLVERWEWHDMLRIAAYEDIGRGVWMRFHYGESRLPAAMTMDRGDGPRAYALGYDQVGSLRAVADTTGTLIKLVQYDSFGNVLHDTAPWLHLPIGFAGGAVDRDTGLVRFGRRDYDPHPGRFTAPDPLGYTGRDPDLYEYAVDDPINVIDPTGEKGEKVDSPAQSASEYQWATWKGPQEPGLEEPFLGPEELAACGVGTLARKGIASAGKVGLGLLAKVGKSAMGKADDLAEAAVNQFGKASLKAMQAGNKVENAVRAADKKVGEAGMKAFEKAYEAAKKVGPGAGAKVVDPRKQRWLQEPLDAMTSYLPGGPPAVSLGGGLGAGASRFGDDIVVASKKSNVNNRSDFEVASKEYAKRKKQSGNQQ